MAYTINLTNGTTFATITDGTVNTALAPTLTLIGKNYAGYGQFLDDNFIRMLENSSNATAPPAPLTGQLWWDSTNTLLKVYSGVNWKNVGGATASNTQPTPTVQGDLWYDIINQQLKVCSVAGAPGTFIVVGPAYSSAQGQSGAIPVSITATTGATYVVTGLYASNGLVGIISDATDFVPVDAGIAAVFPKIYKGFTVYNSGNASGNISNPGNITLAVNGSVIETVASTGVFVTGLVSATGNITAANFVGNVIPPAGGAVSTTGNITGGNLLTSGIMSATGNATGGNLITSGLATVTGNVTAGNVLTGGLISATGNITGGNVLFGSGIVSGTGNITGGNVLFGSGRISGTGNITGGNVLFGSGIVSGIGNITAGYFYGDGTNITGLSNALGNSITKIVNGSSSGNIDTSGGNIVFTVAGTTIMTLYSTGAVVSGTSGLSTPSIEHTGTNAVGNIGSSASYFNRLFATATTALYADVAERFAADEELAPGTVVELGGTAEITRSKQDLSENVFGVISTNAAYLMNGGAGEDNTHPPVAMTGRVPVQVIGVVRKGDRLVSAGDGVARAAQPGEATAFNVIGRALVDKPTPGPGTIEAIVTIK